MSCEGHLHVLHQKFPALERTGGGVPKRKSVTGAERTGCCDVQDAIAFVIPNVLNPRDKKQKCNFLTSLALLSASCSRKHVTYTYCFDTN